MGRKTTARQHCSFCAIDFYGFDWMHFGLCNALTTFQRLMERSMGDMHLRDWLIYHAVPEQGIHTDSSNIEAVHNLPVPRNVKEIRMFLGFTGYYRRFVKGYASIVSTFNDLLIGHPTNKNATREKNPNQSHMNLSGEKSKGQIFRPSLID